MKGLCMLALLLGVAGAHASACEPPKDYNNGCGPEGVLGFFVPERIRHCQFGRACADHDNCYSACLPGGSLCGQPACQPGDARRSQRQQACDDQFRLTLLADNPGRCGEWASLYHWMVSKVGSGFFQGLLAPQARRLFTRVEDPRQVLLRLQLLEALQQRGALRIEDLVVDAQGLLAVPVRDSLRTRLRQGDRIELPAQLLLSRDRLQPLLQAH